jgi:hypothetical protein
VIGSTKSFWPGFVQYIKDQGTVPANPINTYCSKVIQEVIDQVNPPYKYEIRYDHHTPRTGDFVHIQTAAHVAGSYRYETIIH